MRSPSLTDDTAAVETPASTSNDPTGGLTLDAARTLVDDPLEWAAFSHPSAENQQVQVSQVVVVGMHCAACSLNIEQALLSVPGVRAVQVSGASHRARVEWAPEEVLPSVWMGASQRAGYPMIPAQDANARERRQADTRKALWRWLVAGLCMMQIMMYATAVYVVDPGEIPGDLMNLLRWACWILCLPMMLFSCGPFFTNAWRDLRLRRISMDLPVALGMAITFIVSTLGTIEPDGVFGHEVYFDSLGMFVFFLLTGRWLELRLRDRTAGALDAMLSRQPESAERLRADGRYESVSVRRLAVGDVVRVVAGAAFPADGVLLSGETVVDEALLTGESRPLPRRAGMALIAGSINLAAPVQMTVERLGEDTRFARIVSLMEEANTARPASVQLADRVAKPFLWAVLALAALGCVMWWSKGPAQALMVAVSILVVTCPCALSLATPAALLAAAGALAKRGVLVRRLGALEQLASIDTVVFDKTGTLTRDVFTVLDLRLRAGADPSAARSLAKVLAHQSSHPLARALWSELAGGEGGPEPDLVDVEEIVGQGVQARLRAAGGDGATVRLGSRVFCAVPADAAATAFDAMPQVHLADDLGWLATFSMSEQLRSDAIATMDGLRAAGLDVVVLSGDRTAAVQRVAEACGMTRFQGECAPQDKLAWARAAQAQGHAVGMVGDGLNDGPVLAGAQVSFAFGKAVPLAQSKADFVVQGEHLADVLSTVVLARRTVQVIRQNLVWAAVYNLLGVPLAMVGWLPAWLAGLGMALSSLLVVANAARLAPSDVGASADLQRKN